MLQNSAIIYKRLQKQYSRRINLDLKRIKKVLEKLNNPEEQIDKVINVIGSDGKNSFLTSLKFFLEANKDKVNTFTSPHLYDVRHRFWLGNKFISLKEIKKYKKVIEKTKLKLTLFELLTCIYILSATKTDSESYNLVESGLLFKKDSTNLWTDPLAQVITNINYQHQEWVHPKNITEICKQKVGYLSENTNIYIGKQNSKISKIIKKILNKNPSQKVFYGSWKIINKNKKKYYKDKKNLINLNSKYINSDGLWENVALAIKVALDLGIDPRIIKKTLPKIQFEGRVQFIKGKLTKNLKNKNPNQLIKNFKGIFKKIITIKIPNEPSAINSSDLRVIAKNNGFKAIESKNIKDALKKIPTKEKKIVVIFGSLYLVGHALSMN